jgi:hypothetical protein
MMFYSAWGKSSQERDSGMNINISNNFNSNNININIINKGEEERKNSMHSKSKSVTDLKPGILKKDNQAYLQQLCEKRKTFLTPLPKIDLTAYIRIASPSLIIHSFTFIIPSSI